ncbi:thiolase family protein [Nocardia gipuzkoensis]|uniref:thiolase family protein n=1 Tax=Nocardia gipuzkoensis TaxID=2749991 RepID=UPI003EE11A99
MFTPTVVVAGARTPVGSYSGALADVPAHQLGATAVRGATDRAGIQMDEVDEFVIGCVGQVGPDAFNARRVALAAGARAGSTAMNVNRLCGSGLQSIISAALELQGGDAAIVVAGGNENMSRQPFLDFQARDGYRLADHLLVDGTRSLVTDPWGQYPMGVTAERVAGRFGVNRREQDEFAAESQRRAGAALEAGLVDGEIVPVTVAGRKSARVVADDEHPRPGTTVEKLANLQAAFVNDGTVTAGNSSGINDGAAAVVMTTAPVARDRGLPVLGELVAFSKVGVEPEIMGYAPTTAIGRVLQKSGLTLSDIGWIELNEAFAAQAVAVIRDAELDPALVNPLGGAIAWGHPIGATGAILTIRLLQNLRRTGKEHGLVTMCIGGGQALAAIFRVG